MFAIIGLLSTFSSHYRGLLGGSVIKKFTHQCKRHGFNPWVQKIPCRGEWQFVPVFLSGKSHGQGCLAGYGLWGLKELDITKHSYMQRSEEVYLIFSYSVFN